MTNQLSQKITTGSLIKFALPTTIMLIFMSLYQMVDGVFVANFVGSNALSALNIVYPVPSIIVAVSIMLATGGSAIIAKNMGEQKDQEAKENFSLILLVGFLFGMAFLVLGALFIEQLIMLLGATPSLYDYCYDYLLILILAAPLAVFQMLFQTFFVTAGKPNLGLATTVIGGCVNIVFDYIFIAIFHMGVTGAAVATAMGYAVPALVGLLYFTFNRKGTLYIVKPVFRKKVLLLQLHQRLFGDGEQHRCFRHHLPFNILMLQYAGEAGVAAITVVLYAQFLMTSVFTWIFFRYCPMISYNYGRQNIPQLKNLFRISIRIVVIVSLFIFLISELFASYVVRVFTSPESDVFQLARHGFLLFSVSFLFTGVNIFSSAMFTAFSNGKVSAIISFLRTFVFLVLSLVLLPLLMDIDGIWIAVPVAEVLALAVSIFYLVVHRKTYHYMDVKAS